MTMILASIHMKQVTVTLIYCPHSPPFKRARSSFTINRNSSVIYKGSRFFSLFFTNDTLKLVYDHTNAYAWQEIVNKQ